MTIRLLVGDCRERLAELPDESVNCCITSPPYFGLRDYGVQNQMGLEATPAEFVDGLVGVFREVRRVLRDDGTLWLNIGDSYAGSGRGFGDTTSANKGQTASRAVHTVGGQRTKAPDGFKPKDLIGIPWMLAFALRADGWYLRQDIIWSKPNPMPESVRDRCTKSHEYVFLLSKSARYHYDADAIREPLTDATLRRIAQGVDGQNGSDRAHGGTKHGGPMKAFVKEGFGANKRSVWSIGSQPYAGAHFATFPPALVEPCVLAGCPPLGTVLDPFAGAGTTGLVADRLQRHAVLIELNTEYAELARRRIIDEAPLLVVYV